MTADYSNIRALIIDPVRHSRNLLRTQLRAFGLKEIKAAATTGQGLLVLRESYFNVVFCDEMGGNPAQFMKTLRRDLSTRNVLVPVILICAGLQEEQIAVARDAGMNDVMVTPICLATIERKLYAALSMPRDFVATKTFIGPDRRRPRVQNLPETSSQSRDRRDQSTAADVFVVPPIVKLGPA